jgi:aspartyl-tRNA(Asn)/glutamyl-tRNA(Gln) amidotransferase subunit C
MQIDETLLRRLEKLSFLEIPQEHRAEMISQLSEIVSFVDNLSELNTEGVEATFAMSDVSTALREDFGNVDKRLMMISLHMLPMCKTVFSLFRKLLSKS